MSRVTPALLPRLTRLLAGLGKNLRKARRRRGYSAETVAQRAGITRKTLARVEQGDAAVALGVYARVLQALGLVDDLEAVARDDVLGRKLQDLNLETRQQHPRGSLQELPSAPRVPAPQNGKVR